MQGYDVDHTPVRLLFGLTREDLLDAFAAQYRVARRPWYLRRPFAVLLMAIGALSLAVMAGPVIGGRLSVAAIALPLLPIVAAMVFAEPRLLYRSAVRQLLKGNPALSLAMTATVSPAGIRTSGATGETAANWTQYPYHAESERVFALLASEQLGGAVLTLPKRGLTSGDAQALRSLLASHSRRLG